ncbi:MAG: hypothetical protein A2Z20_12980 [Bdellovibrionales bacterium RBG_16_40_8]|nr:MAG: hypothetical protein A2Z20_12980 [Bdellovibrionales bacterium RBG_16_40_8]
MVLLNNTGGLKYHLRAFWHRKRWRPFCEFVEIWLNDWVKDLDLNKRQTLVLIGPNAGYTLSQSFISQFRNIIVIEPDPLAYAMFEARFHCGARLVRQDYFSLSDNPPNPEKLRGLFLAFPNSVFLFCNVLGQLPVILREKKGVNVEDYMRRLAKVLHEEIKHHCMASYHDRYSRNLKKPNEFIDHLTGELFTDVKDKKEFPWRLTRLEEHQIEFVRS